MGNKIQLFGELESVAVDKKLVDAVQVKDSAWVDPEEMILALAEKRDPVATEETQSKINERLREEALYAQSQFNNLSIHYNEQDKKLQLLLEGESLNGDGIDASAFTKDGMIETVLGPVTPVWDDVTDKVAAGTKTEKAKWAVAEDTGEQAFFALDVPPTGYLLIQEITLGNTYLGFIWNTNTDAGKPEGKVYDSKNFKASALDVSKLVDAYTAGEGLDLKDNQFSIRLGGQSEGYLKIDGNNYLVIQGVDKKIEDTVAVAKNGLTDSIEGLTTRLDAAEIDIDAAQTDIVGNTNNIKTLNNNITDLCAAYDTLEATVNQNKADIETLQSNLDDANANITTIQNNVSNLETAYKDADAKLKTELQGGTSSTKDDLSIVGVKLYADSVAKEAHGYKLQKTVASGNSTPLWANRTNPNATADETGYEVDKSSIVVLWKLEEIEVQIAHKADSPVTVSWSGIEPTSNSPLVIQYRVIAKKS